MEQFETFLDIATQNEIVVLLIGAILGFFSSYLMTLINNRQQRKIIADERKYLFSEKAHISVSNNIDYISLIALQLDVELLNFNEYFHKNKDNFALIKSNMRATANRIEKIIEKYGTIEGSYENALQAGLINAYFPEIDEYRSKLRIILNESRRFLSASKNLNKMSDEEIENALIEISGNLYQVVELPKLYGEAKIKLDNLLLSKFAIN